MRGALLGRSLVGVCFAVLIATAASWMDAADRLRDYFWVDGTVALIVSGFFLREAMQTRATREGALTLVLFIDGAGRIAAGIATHYWPGLLEFPVTLAAFLGFMAMCTAGVGLTEGTIFVEEEAARHGRKHSRPQFPAGPVGVASIASIGFGVGAMVTVGNVDLMQKLLAAHIASIAVVMAGLGWARHQRLVPIGPR